MRTVMLLIVFASAGCLRTTEYQCSTDTSCGGAGRCESDGFCSFPDPDCGGGYRYADSAGSRAGQCAGGNTGSDGGVVDASDAGGGIDSGSDGSTNLCPAGYVAVTGAPGHLYKVLSAVGTWDAQRSQCKLTSPRADLAIPGDLAELTALDAVAGAARYWVGVTDVATQTVWLDVAGNAQTFLPWLAPAPDYGNPVKNCVEAISATHQFNNERCANTSRAAICECTP